jgi:hypothetical protein
MGKKSGGQYKSFRTIFGILVLELSAYLLGKQIDCALQIYEDNKGSKFLDETEVLLWRYTTPFNYMYMRWPDYLTRLHYLVEGIQKDVDGEWFRDHAYQVSQRYISRCAAVKQNRWLQARLLKVREHRGLLEHSSWPWMHIRNEAERHKIEIVRTLPDLMKCTVDGLVFEHEEVAKDWTSWRTSQADWDDKDYYPKFIGPLTPRWCPSQENANELAKELHLEERREEKIRKENGWGLPDEDNEDLAGMVAESDDEQTNNFLPLPIKPTTLQKFSTSRPGSSNDKDRIPRQDSKLAGGETVQESTRGRSRELSTRERELEFTRGRRRGDSKEREYSRKKREDSEDHYEYSRQKRDYSEDEREYTRKRRGNSRDREFSRRKRGDSDDEEYTRRKRDDSRDREYTRRKREDSDSDDEQTRDKSRSKRASSSEGEAPSPRIQGEGWFEDQNLHPALAELANVAVISGPGGAPKVQMDYAVWCKMRDYMRTMDKYVEDQFRYRFRHAKYLKKSRDGRAEPTPRVTEKSSKQRKGGNKGFRVN